MRPLNDGVGSVLDTLHRHGLTLDTIVVFTSDDGSERFSYMLPLRGEKTDLWEGGTRVPLIVKWPGTIARGSTTDQVAMSMDFLPTFAAIAGANLDPSIPPDVIDLTPARVGGPTKNGRCSVRCPAICCLRSLILGNVSVSTTAST